jgi:hypothetical protein
MRLAFGIYAGALLACLIAGLITIEAAGVLAERPAPDPYEPGDQAWQVLDEARRITEQAARED